MADAPVPVVHIGENSPENIAYKLLELIAQTEKTPPVTARDRKWILDTYAECLQAVRAPHFRLE